MQTVFGPLEFLLNFLYCSVRPFRRETWSQTRCYLCHFIITFYKSSVQLLSFSECAFIFTWMMTDMAPYTLVWVDRFGNVVFFFFRGRRFILIFIFRSTCNWVETRKLSTNLIFKWKYIILKLQLTYFCHVNNFLHPLYPGCERSGERTRNFWLHRTAPHWSVWTGCLATLESLKTWNNLEWWLPF